MLLPLFYFTSIFYNAFFGLIFYRNYDHIECDIIVSKQVCIPPVKDIILYALKFFIFSEHTFLKNDAQFFNLSRLQMLHMINRLLRRENWIASFEVGNMLQLKMNSEVGTKKIYEIFFTLN